MTCPETCPWSSQTEESRLDRHEAILERQQAQIDELCEEANTLRGHLEEAGVLFSQALVLDVNLFCGAPMVRSQWSAAFIRGAGSMQMSKGVQIPELHFVLRKEHASPVLLNLTRCSSGAQVWRRVRVWIQEASTAEPWTCACPVVPSALRSHGSTPLECVARVSWRTVLASGRRVLVLCHLSLPSRRHQTTIRHGHLHQKQRGSVDLTEKRGTSCEAVIS